MLIRGFQDDDIATINDVKNIKECKRIIIIYEHTTKAHFLKEQLSNNFDLFMANISCTFGTGYIIPSGDVLHSYNSYRGYINNPFTETGRINPNAIVKMYQSFFVNRYSMNGNMSEPIKLSTTIKGSEGYIINEMSRNAKHYNPLTPLPIYYNDEHQRRFANDDNKDFDFSNIEGFLPTYCICELIDNNTRVVKVSLSYEFDDYYDGVYPNEGFDDGNPEWVMFEAFSRLYEITIRNMFKNANFIFNIEDETFNVLDIYMQYTETLTKSDMALEFKIFLESVQEVFDRCLENLLVINNEHRSKRICRVYFYINETSCKIKVVQQYSSKGNGLIKGDTRDRSNADIEEDLVSLLD